ncbi:MAG TPA: hydantoinase B/oxoprolinase family protein [Candidatus Dormibacteraeota bacterium]|nr:hydantoinase B/oxoprolinase family protein [Candidatus Dormibacteraeota bacterium]
MPTDHAVTVIIRNSLVYASEEMGIALRNSSYSPNIRERMDHSAAIFDYEGRLLAQAEHIPVHLGSLPWGLTRTLDYCEKEGIELEPSSMIMVNNPYIAGTHLNDVTVIRPIHHSRRLVGYAANKAHHSDVGGKVPGSISTDAESLFEEGVVIDPRHLIRKNRFVEKAVKALASKSRTPKERMGDLKAQTAANITGERRVLELLAKHGLRTFQNACKESLKKAELLARLRLSRLPSGRYLAEDFLEDPDGHNIRLQATITLSKRELRVDYTGTDAQVSNPLNAVFGVSLSGVYYVTRTLLGDDIPANHGAFAPIQVYAPDGSILNPTFPHPVAGGNVETSQRNADLLYRAFSKAVPDKVPADSGGSMNNVMMGGIWKGKNWAFYETIGVGLGAQRDRDGVDGIQANMTNTMNTPIEEIERSYPLLITQYELRTDSAGSGQHRGGTGIVRSYKALADQTTVTILAERGRNQPQGLFRGGSGARAALTLYKKVRGRIRKVPLPVKATVVLRKGEIIEIRTAGGGGYGAPGDRDVSLAEKDVENGLVTG